jgi:hypothetical protein
MFPRFRLDRAKDALVVEMPLPQGMTSAPSVTETLQVPVRDVLLGVGLDAKGYVISITVPGLKNALAELAKEAKEYREYRERVERRASGEGGQ